MLLPTFITERLILRSVAPSDVSSYEKHFVDYEVIQHLAAHVPWPYPENGVAWFLENNIFPSQGKTAWMWGIFEKNNPGELIGAVHLWREGKPEHRGFWLGKRFWNKGYMTEAVSPVMDFAFNRLQFDRLVFANAVGNSRSGRIKEKTGAVRIDVQPAKFVNPDYKEHEIWELKKENWKSDQEYFYISSEKEMMNVEQVHSLLVDAYWCKGIPKDTLKIAMKNSICFGIHKKQQQVGFARVVTDESTFAWLCDVIVDPKYRGNSLSKELMRNIQSHPSLSGLRRFCLATKDAHELYKQFNFKMTDTPQNWMEIKDKDIYLKNKKE